MKKPVSSYTDIGELRRLMANARRMGRDDVFHEAFRRRCELEGVDHDDPLARDFYAMLAAYEELLTEKNGRTTLASRTRQKLANKGVAQCLEDWAIGTAETDGFRVLARAGLIELTGEYLVTKYPDRFSAKAVQRATERLAAINQGESQHSEVIAASAG